MLAELARRAAALRRTGAGRIPPARRPRTAAISASSPPGETTPEFEQALVRARRRARCRRQPVATRFGFHIIRLDRKIEGRELPFELVAGRIADYLREAVTRRAAAQYIARLVSRADIRGIALADAAAHRVN